MPTERPISNVCQFLGVDGIASSRSGPVGRLFRPLARCNRWETVVDCLGAIRLAQKAIENPTRPVLTRTPPW
jgi:hypothetical protein